MDKLEIIRDRYEGLDDIPIEEAFNSMKWLIEEVDRCRAVIGMYEPEHKRLIKIENAAKAYVNDATASLETHQAFIDALNNNPREEKT